MKSISCALPAGNAKEEGKEGWGKSHGTWPHLCHYGDSTGKNASSNQSANYTHKECSADVSIPKHTEEVRLLAAGFSSMFLCQPVGGSPVERYSAVILMIHTYITLAQVTAPCLSILYVFWESSCKAIDSLNVWPAMPMVTGAAITLAKIPPHLPHIVVLSGHSLYVKTRKLFPLGVRDTSQQLRRKGCMWDAHPAKERGERLMTAFVPVEV